MVDHPRRRPDWLSVIQIAGVYLILGTTGAFVVEFAPHDVATTPAVREFAVPADSDAAEWVRYRDEAVALVLAEELAWFHIDPLVWERLVQNQRFVQNEGELNVGDQELFMRALAMGMHQDDPVVRRRMLSRLIQLLEAEVPDPTESEIVVYVHSNRGRFVTAEQRRFETLFQKVPRDQDGIDKRSPRPWFDSPPPLAHFGSQSELQRAWGKDLATAIFACSRGQWCGPVLSAYGVHWVKVTDIIAESEPSVDQSREWIAEKIKAERRERWVRQRLDQLASRLGLVPVRVGVGEDDAK
ncbi:MAG: peptidyl-prolyl cis-trans isomerase [Myxococcales bacterium]|nr:peptidyl-prolyl cis-trans isomerase [Myxococcales bacterium]